MGRTKGAQNKKPLVQPLNSELILQERLELLANLVVDRIVADQAIQELEGQQP